jgi:hypothetical protein
MKQKKLIGKKPEVTHYTKADHIGFHVRGIELCRKYGQIIDSPELIDHYNRAVEQESNAFNWPQRSEYTNRKAAIDRQRSKTYRGICDIATTQLKHPDPSLHNAALHINILLKSYGNIPRTNYDSRTADIDSLISRLHDDAYRPAAETLGLHPWIDELEALNSRFKTFVENTAREKMARPKPGAHSTRIKSNEALSRIIARIEAQITLHGPEPFAAFAKEYNVLVKEYNTLVHEHYGRLHVRTDIAPAIIGPIGAQPCTGRPVTVIPEVALRRTAPDGTLTQLFFPDDFTVAYRNNRRPGTATLIIRGAGRYRGEVVTTFNIIRE